MDCRQVARAFVLPLLLLGAPACSDSPTEPAPFDWDDVSFAPELGVDLDAMSLTFSGVYYEDLTVGEGELVEIGAEVTVHYTGWLPDGTEFDSTVGGDPFTFVIGQTGTIVGFQEGMLEMREGGVRLMAIPPDLAYGSDGVTDQEGNTVIPPNSAIVFEVEMVSVSPPAS